MNFSILPICINMKTFEFKKSNFGAWLTLLSLTFVLSGGTMEIGHVCVDSLSKRIIDGQSY